MFLTIFPLISVQYRNSGGVRFYQKSKVVPFFTFFSVQIDIETGKRLQRLPYGIDIWLRPHLWYH